MILLSVLTILFQTISPIKLAEKDEGYTIPLCQMEILVDTTHRLTIENLLGGDSEQQFRTYGGNVFKIIEIEHPHWVRLKFDLKGVAGKKWLLEAIDPHIAVISVYMVDGEQVTKIGPAGFGKGFHARPVPHKNFIYEIPEESSLTDGQVVVYVKVEAYYANLLMFKAKPLDEIFSYALNEYLLLGLFYGVMFIMAVYNLLLYFTIKEKLYLWYVLYVLSCVGIALSEDGLGFQYIWPDTPQVNLNFGNYAEILFLIFFVLYAQSFLKIRYNYPFIAYFLAIMVVVYSIYYQVAVYFDIKQKLPLVYALPFCIIYFTGWYSLLKGQKSARFFVLGYSLTVIGLYFFILRRFGIKANDSIYSVYSLNIGLITEVLFFSLAQADRFKMMKVEKETAQRRVISQLKQNEQEIEQKVIDRTREIAEKNSIIEDKNYQLERQAHKLRAQSVEIQRINDLLSQENKALQVNVNELTKARVLMQDVDLSEFEKIFPDEQACYQYLSDLKWANGYQCLKCGNEKYNSGHGHFARRCTKCGYDESCMVNTIFHRIHIPIQKAFSILFLQYANNNTVPAAELSRILDLRQSTCWKFSKKIAEKAEALKKQKHEHAQELDGWSQLILVGSNKV